MSRPILNGGQPMTDGRIQQLEAELSAVKQELRRRDQAWQAQIQIATSVHDSLLPRPIRHPQIDIDTRYVPVDRCRRHHSPDTASPARTTSPVASHSNRRSQRRRFLLG